MAARKKSANINLIIKDQTGDSISEQFLAWILTYGRYIIIITQIVVLSVFFFRFKIDREHTDIKEKVTQEQAVLESSSFPDLETETRRVQGKLLNIRTISTRQDSLIKVIRFLQQRTPTDTIFSSLILTTEKISFQATSGNLRSFSYMLRQIQQDKKFSEVTLQDMSRKADGRIDFKIDAKVNINEFI
ncbi:hypothetical protein HY029_02045 [Candidatus Gottesmanbacteria bacterium]|nr:hypothetical protein [Candidatus Gottesmanbacteria bacterium]